MGEGWGEGGDNLRDREDDIIWRVRWLYLYLIIEFQSTVAPFMAVRLPTYIGLLYQDLKRTKRLESDSPLPPVLPIVLYNGIDRWSAATEPAEMREPDLPRPSPNSSRTCATSPRPGTSRPAPGIRHLAEPGRQPPPPARPRTRPGLRLTGDPPNTSSPERAGAFRDLNLVRCRSGRLPGS